MHHASTEFFCKTSNHPGDLASLQPRSGTLWLLAFPKTKIIFEREEISDCRRDIGKYDGAADGDWENCVKTQGAYFEGDWGIIVLCTMFLVSCIWNKCLYFHTTWIDNFWTDLVCVCIQTHIHTCVHKHTYMHINLLIGNIGSFSINRAYIKNIENVSAKLQKFTYFRS